MIVLGGVSSVTAYISLSRRFNNRLELKLGFIKSQTRKMPNSMVAVVPVKGSHSYKTKPWKYTGNILMVSDGIIHLQSLYHHKYCVSTFQ